MEEEDADLGPSEKTAKDTEVKGALDDDNSREESYGAQSLH